MKNRVKYVDFLIDCAANMDGFGVDKDTNKPRLCKDMNCVNNCKFQHSLSTSCTEFRKKWLDEDVDEWADFRDLKRGDIIMLSVSGLWYPVIFVRFDEFGLRYSRSIDNRGDFVCEVGFEDNPRYVKKCLRREYYEQ